jgi:predicted kinase
MSGVPGSGKSTIAGELASRLQAVVLDHDDTKTAILNSGVSESQAGAASYEVIKVLSARVLEQGFSVIVDSPCLYTQLLEHGISSAFREGAEYRYIECVLPDLAELDRRLRARHATPCSKMAPAGYFDGRRRVWLEGAELCTWQ